MQCGILNLGNFHFESIMPTWVPLKPPVTLGQKVMLKNMILGDKSLKMSHFHQKCQHINCVHFESKNSPSKPASSIYWLASFWTILMTKSHKLNMVLSFLFTITKYFKLHVNHYIHCTLKWLQLPLLPEILYSSQPLTQLLDSSLNVWIPAVNILTIWSWVVHLVLLGIMPGM